LVFVENHLCGCYSNHTIIAKQHALVYRASSTMEFLTVFADNQSCLKQFSCPQNTRYHNWRVFEVLLFSFDKGLLAPLVYCVVICSVSFVQSQPKLPPVAVFVPCNERGGIVKTH